MIMLILALTTACTDDVKVLGGVTLDKDTIWDGSFLIEGDVYVPPGVTLTIMPGTMIKFKRIDEKSDKNLFVNDSPYYPQAEIIVRGKIIAKGTRKKPIVFTSAEMDAGPADWGAINLLGSKGNILEYVKVLCAYNGVHAHGSSALITNSEFTRNGVAISFKKEFEYPEVPWFGEEADLEITHNLIHNNKGGIGFRKARADISYNDIRENKFFGIWLKEVSEGIISYNDIEENKKNIFLYQVKGVKIEFNNIYDPRDYNIAVAEEQDMDLNVANNWWGTVNRAKIEETVYDKMEDEEVGRIIYEPFLRSKVREAGL
jgi:parallel beta-helix repeat protein